jgi:DNA segregation ATPase FtsK/SpoIIIE, S-DNA-T family
MRLALTVVSPAAKHWADVVIDADPATPVADIAADLERMTSGAPSPATPGGAGPGGLGYGAGGAGGAGAGPGGLGYGAGGTDAGPGGRLLQFPGLRSRGPLASRASGSPAGYETLPRPAPPIPLFVDFRQVAPQLTLASSPIRNGSVVSLGDPSGCLRPEPAGLVEIRVAGGPNAGGVHRISLGDADIGSGEMASIRVGDRSMPPLALHLSVDSGGHCLVTPHQGVTATLDREPLAGTVPWPPGQLIAIGDTLLGIAAYEPPDAALHPGEDGVSIDFNRPPRLLPPGRRTRFALPTPPHKQDRRPLPILMAVVPVLLGVGLAYLTRQIYMLAMCAMSPVMVLGSYVSDRKHGRKTGAQRMAEYHEHKARVEQDARLALEAERRQKRDDCPDPATILSIASGPRRRLWERRRTDPDYLLLRAGTADMPSAVELTDPTQDEHRRLVVWEIPDAPVTIPLAQRGVLGVAGPAGAPRAIGRWLVAQAAALHSPNDLQIYILTDGSAESGWEWARWLPHLRPAQAAPGDPPPNCVALIGNDAETVAGRLAELLAIINSRNKTRRESNGDQSAFFPSVLVVFDGSRRLRSLPGAIQVLREGPQAGVFAICLDGDERLLPAECQAVTVVEPDGLRVQQMSGATHRGVRPDHVSPGWCALLARRIAPVRDASDDEETSTLPEESRLLDVLQLEPPGPDLIGRRWLANGQSTVATLGESYDGPFAVDLRRDGPHGLVAGTTGAGKSELLQTLVASLAVANRPDAMTFVLIDYKGGSAFKDCARLPHTVGMVSDLDGHLTERALASLSAELKRREEILLRAGAKDIEDYGDARRTDPALPPLPRLVLIIDEFASLVAELPDFVTGLVGIAQRGRSLGVHLILATQRPAGVVSADIRANTNLRISLRVTDASESSDVIDVPDAAWISKATPGRCYVRSGAATPVGVQAARIGGRRPGATGPARDPLWLVPVPWHSVGRPLPEVRQAIADVDGSTATDLSVLVDAICAAAQRLDCGRQPSPWLPPLPDLITLEEVAAARSVQDVAPIPFGLTDVPARQAREAMTLDLAHGGHVVVAGAARTGRSTLLRTIAGSIAAREPAADVHIYAIDAGTGALLPLTALPHCGAVVTRDQTDRIERLIGKLRAEITRRQQLLAADGYAGVAEQRAHADPEQRLPWMVLLIDWWEGYFAAYEKYDYGRLIDSLLQLIREGAAVGMRVVVTTDRMALLGQTGTVFEKRLLLRLNEPSDAGQAHIRERSLPTHQPPGRIMMEGVPDPLEVQVALLDADPSGPAQVAALRRLGEQSLARYGAPRGGMRPLRVDTLPARITLDGTRRLVPGFVPPSPLWALLGAGGDELMPQGLDVRDEGPGLTVAGPPRSGRSSTLVTMATWLLEAGTPVLALTPRRSPLRSLQGRPGVVGVLDGEATPEEVTAAVAGLERFVVLVDDAELLFNGPLSAPLEKILASGRDGEHGLIIAGATGDLTRAYSGFIKEALKSRCGVLTAVDSPGDGDLFGVRLPRNAGPGPLGRGLLVRPGTTEPLQLALAD